MTQRVDHIAFLPLPVDLSLLAGCERRRRKRGDGEGRGRKRDERGGRKEGRGRASFASVRDEKACPVTEDRSRLGSTEVVVTVIFQMV